MSSSAPFRAASGSTLGTAPAATPVAIGPPANGRSARGRLSRGARAALWAALAGGLVGSVPTLVMGAALPQIAADLGTTTVFLGWAVTGPLLASAIAMPVLGKLGDLYGHRRVFLFGLVVAAASSALTPFAWDGWSFIAIRVITQVAGLAIQPSGIAMINANVPARRLGSAFGAWAFVSAAGPAIGLVGGGVLIDTVGWWAIFAVQALLGVVAVAFTLLAPDGHTRRAGVRFDTRGAVALGTTTLGVMVVLNQGIAVGWASPVVIAGLAAAVGGGAAYWLVERRQEHPLIPPFLARQRVFTTAVAAQFFTQVATMGMLATLPLFLLGALDASPATAALALLAMPFSFGPVAMVGGRLAAHHGQRLASIAGTAVMVAGAAVSGLAGLVTSGPLAVAGLALLGAGNGLCRPGYTMAVARSGGERHVGIATATERMFNQIGSAAGVAILLAIAASGTSHDFTVAMVTAAGFTAVALVIAIAFITSDAPGPRSGADALRPGRRGGAGTPPSPAG